MKKTKCALLLICSLISLSSIAQNEVILLYPGKAPGSEQWDWTEKTTEKNAFNTPLVYNVTNPTLTAFIPSEGSANGTAVIICPGGGYQVLSIENEGIAVAQWLKSRGVAAFVLKYRLMKSLTDNPAQEMTDKIAGKVIDTSMLTVFRYAGDDGRAAVAWVRAHAAKYHISPNRVGIMGFSAGGGVAMDVVYRHDVSSKPDFAAPIYPYVDRSKPIPVPSDAPPLFITAATDDQLGLAPVSSGTYEDWIKAGKKAELHIYAKGGHGFGMRKQNLPIDQWIDRFGEWLDIQGLLYPANPTGWEKNFTPDQIRQFRKDDEKRNREDWGNLTRYAADNAKLAPVKSGEKRVVFMGNSITEGWIATDPDFFKGRPYVDRGISGQTSPQNLLRFRQDVVNLNPTVVVLMIGINDIAQNTGPYDEDKTMDNISAMAEIARSNQIRVVLCSVMPAYDFPWRAGLQPATKVIALNKRIKAYAEKNGFTYLDYHSAMADERQGLPVKFSEDGVHPNLAGYKVMEPLAEKAIAAALKKKP